MAKIDNCSKCDCGSKRVIVNMRHYLCQEKNRDRLDSQTTTKAEKIKTVKKVSEKQKNVLLELKKVYQEIAEEREHICTGCESKNNLTHSHKIPRSRRKDLETDKKNITYHCFTCHQIYEHGSYKERQKLLDFEETMEYIKTVDLTYYNLLMIKWEKEK